MFKHKGPSSGIYIKSPGSSKICPSQCRGGQTQARGKSNRFLSTDDAVRRRMLLFRGLWACGEGQAKVVGGVLKCAKVAHHRHRT
jgi:hypothetical protein